MVKCGLVVTGRAVRPCHLELKELSAFAVTPALVARAHTYFFSRVVFSTQLYGDFCSVAGTIRTKRPRHSGLSFHVSAVPLHRLPAFLLKSASAPVYHVWFCFQYLLRCCFSWLRFSYHSTAPTAFSFLFLPRIGVFFPFQAGQMLATLM